MLRILGKYNRTSKYCHHQGSFHHCWMCKTSDRNEALGRPIISFIDTISHWLWLKQGSWRHNFFYISSFTTQLIKIQIQEEIQTQIQMQTQIQRMTERGRGESLITIRGWPRVILGPSAACIASSQDWITVIWMNWIARNWIGSLGFAHQRNFFSGLLSLCPVDNSPKHIKHKHI